MPEAFAKTKKATNILRPAIDAIFLATTEEFLATTRIALLHVKSKRRKKRGGMERLVLIVADRSQRGMLSARNSPRYVRDG